MQFSTLQKSRMPPRLIDYLLQIPEAQILPIKSGMLQDSSKYFVGQLKNFGDELQLVMLLQIYTPNGGSKALKALIDTGAEASLVRRGLFSDSLFGRAHKPIQLVAANGQHLGGGQKTIRLGVGFTPNENGTLYDEVRFDALCYEADINVDLILSYPWMRENKIGIFPHHRALVMDEPRLMLLYGLQDEEDQTQPQQNEDELNVFSCEDLESRAIGYIEFKCRFTLPMDGLDVMEEFLCEEEVHEVLERAC